MSGLHSLSAIAVLIPGLVAALDRRPASSRIFWWMGAIAFVGTAGWVVGQSLDAWRPGLASALWASVLATLTVFLGASALSREARLLDIVVYPYLIVLAVMATGITLVGGLETGIVAPGAWLIVHIAVSLATYGLVTLAALAAISGLIQERQLKSRKPGAHASRLPSISGSERLQVRCLGAAGGILAVGIVSGFAAQYFIDGSAVILDHKTVLSILAFVVIVAVLIAQSRPGLRGRQLGRAALLAWLLVTLAFPGVQLALWLTRA